MNDSFVVYASYLKAAKRLNDADRLAVYDAIMEYGIEGTEPETDGVAAAIFEIVKPLIDANMKKREAGRKGGEAKRSNPEAEAKQNEAEAKQTEANRKQNEAEAKQNEADPEKVPSNVNVNGNGNGNVNVNGNGNANVKGGSGGRFQRPTPAEVRAYCEERKNSIDPDAFISYYESNGWRVGKNPMKDWKAAVRNWERMDKERGNPPQRSGTTNKFNQYEGRQKYDFAAMEAAFESDVGEYANEQEEFKKFLASG